MKVMLAAALCLSQISGAALAADLDGRTPFMENQRGAFAGVRFRANLGGERTQARASLAVAPTVHNRIGSNSRMGLGDGLELSFSPGKAKPELMLAGKRLDEMNFFARPQDRKKDLSTVATVAIVAGVVLVVGAVAFNHVMSEASCFHGGDDGDC